MEYKLNKSEFYKVGYCLAGLFMFLFLFGILSLSSYAVSPSTRSLSLSPSESYSEIYGTYYYSYDLDDYSVPVTTITTSTGGSGYTQNNYNGTVRGSNTVHLVTSEGDFVVNINQGLSDVNDRTVTVLGVPQRVYAEFNAYNNQSSAVTTYATFQVNSISVSDLNLNSGGGRFSDYSSFSFLNSTNSVGFVSSFGGSLYDAGSLICYNVKDIDVPLASFPLDSYVNFSDIGALNYVFYFNFYTSSQSAPDLTGLGVYLVRNGVTTFYPLSNATYVGVSQSTITGFSCHSYYINVDLGFFDSLNDFSFTFSVPAGLKGLDFSLLKFKATVSDYMGFVQQNWDNISPSVTTTNQNIAQSVSDIGTAQTFESGAFSDFDTSMTSSGLDTFSLSFNSTPLYWCAGLINTFYNYMPSGFQYLLMFVAFIGILVIVLNIAGRVVRRFGGD